IGGCSMKRGLKKILIIILILILTIGTFNCAKKVLMRNIFDEMYFGTKDIWGGHLTSTSWNNMSGLAKMNDSSKYEIPNIIRIYFSKLYLTENENFSVLWRMDIKHCNLYIQYTFKNQKRSTDYFRHILFTLSKAIGSPSVALPVTIIYTETPLAEWMDF
ncbi:MAG: hypothetical protein ACLUMK_09415, partial [Christensenellales bacterium]